MNKQPLDDPSPAHAPTTDTSRIDLTRDLDVAYWCRIFDVDVHDLRRAVQQVGPRAEAVARVLLHRPAQGPMH